MKIRCKNIKTKNAFIYFHVKIIEGYQHIRLKRA